MIDLKSFLRSAPCLARIELTAVRGSSPREAGTVMFVTPDGTHGTIGGGQLEYMVIDQARAMLSKGEKSESMAIPLGPEIGQCCGGFVEIELTRMDDTAVAKALHDEEEAITAHPTVFIFGAGHVGRALADSLALLPVQVVLSDERPEELALCQAPVRKIVTPLPEAEVRRAPEGSAFVILTHEHSLDFLIAAEALARPDARYVGMIGSRTKRVSFERWCNKNINPPVEAERLVCPIGASDSKDKRPEVIAALVTAEVIERLTTDSHSSSADRMASEMAGGG